MQQPMKTNIFKNLKSPYVWYDLDILDVIHLIKSNPNHSQIIKARNLGKGHPLYEGIKNVQPTFSPNAYFNVKRTLKNLKQLTGLIYLDIDHNFNPSILKTIPFVYASWISFGGEGYGVLVSIDNLTLTNFTSVWYYLSNYFDKYDLTIDNLTKDITRQNVISSDPDLYLNPNCINFDATQVVTNQPSTTFSANNLFTVSTATQSFTSKYLFESTSNTFQPIKYRTTLADFQGKDLIVIEEGIPSRDTFLPMVIIDGKRHFWLKNYCLDIMFNNPSISIDQLRMELLKVNYNRCKPPLESKEVINIVHWNYETFSNDPQSIPSKKKKIHINPKAKRSTKEKRVLIGQQVGILRRKKTISELIDIYVRLKATENDVSPKLLSKNSSVKIRTIQKYWLEITEGALCK